MPVALAAVEVAGAVHLAARAVFAADLVGADLCPDLYIVVGDPHVVRLGEAKHQGVAERQDNKGSHSEAVYRCGRSA